MTYGFDIMSLYNLFNKGIKVATNPYNRNPFPKFVKKNMLKIKWLSSLFNDKVNFNMDHTDDNGNDNVWNDDCIDNVCCCKNATEQRGENSPNGT